jgi:hypothetical protein
VTVCSRSTPVNKRHLDMVYAHMRYSTRRSWARSPRRAGATRSTWPGLLAPTTSRTIQ